MSLEYCPHCGYKLEYKNMEICPSCEEELIIKPSPQVSPTPEEKPSEEKPSEEKPPEQKPSEEKPSEEKPPEQKPSEEKPPEQKKPPKKETGNNNNKGLKIFLLIIIILAIVAVISFFVSSVIFSPIIEPNSDKTEQTFKPTTVLTTDTIVPTPQPTVLSCDFTGNWIQQNVAGFVYLQIYPNKRIEIYLNNQLRSWGMYDFIAPNQIRFTWSGGADVGTGATITATSDCQSLEVVSFLGEHATFKKS